MRRRGCRPRHLGPGQHDTNQRRRIFRVDRGAQRQSRKSPIPTVASSPVAGCAIIQELDRAVTAGAPVVEHLLRGAILRERRLVRMRRSQRFQIRDDRHEIAVRHELGTVLYDLGHAAKGSGVLVTATLQERDNIPLVKAASMAATAWRASSHERGIAPSHPGFFHMHPMVNLVCLCVGRGLLMLAGQVALEMPKQLIAEAFFLPVA